LTTTDTTTRTTPVGRQAPPRGFSIRRRTGRWRDALRRRLLAVADVITVTVASALGGLLADQPVLTVAMLPVWVLLAKLYGLYDRDHRSMRHLTANELGDIVAWAATGSLGVLVASALFDSGVESAAGARLAVGVAVLSPISRAAARRLWRAIVPPDRVLIVGSGELAEATQRKVELFGDMHNSLVGIIDDLALVETPAAALETLRRVQERDGLDRVILTTATLDKSLLASLTVACRELVVKLGFVPPAPAAFASTARLAHVAELPVVDCVTWEPSRSTLLLKRCLDLGVAAVILLVTLPLLVVIALTIRLTSRGPALFRQQRAGISGRPFWMWKFRTMDTDAEAQLGSLMALDELTEPAFKLRGDPRVTSVGRVLRRMSLDELPQLINVLRGQMSLVGPRPEQLEVVERYDAEDRIRLAIKPGMTGPMQVLGRGDLSFTERVAVERDYVESISLSQDLRILALTVGAVISGRGAS
jgi:exopolysaccharide biosynthesis polyprenyl glycosylphosphotransferase